MAGGNSANISWIPPILEEETVIWFQGLASTGVACRGCTGSGFALLTRKIVKHILNFEKLNWLQKRLLFVEGLTRSPDGPGESTLRLCPKAGLRLFAIGVSYTGLPD